MDIKLVSQLLILQRSALTKGHQQHIALPLIRQPIDERYLNRNDYLGDLSVKYTISGKVYDVKLADMPSQMTGSDLQHVRISWQLPASLKLSQTFSVAGSDMDWNISISNGSRQASFTLRGSALYTPATSLQMVTRETPASAPICVAE